ncbi:hypothetical protein OFB51_25195, partial [Escherichia coli]|nr:hypothetical protein [Escherichia coli]
MVEKQLLVWLTFATNDTQASEPLGMVRYLDPDTNQHHLEIRLVETRIETLCVQAFTDVEVKQRPGPT